MTQHKPRMLFLSQTLPYPPDGGVKIRTYNVLRILSQAFSIHALCFYRWKQGLITDDPAGDARALAHLAELEHFPIPQEHSAVRLLWDHARSIAARRAYTAYVYDSAAFRKRLEDVLSRERFDIVHVDSLDLARYFPALTGIPLVCVHHDVQSELLRRRASSTTSPRKQYYLLQSGFMRREEQLCRQVDLNVVVSEADQALLQNSVGGSYAVVPNGVDTDYFRPGTDRGISVISVGGLSWLPNEDGLSFFAGSILPQLRRLGVRNEVIWIGRTTPAQQKRFARSGVTLTGYVTDIRPHVSAARCYVVPLRFGGGTRVKILDAWAMGKAVVSTAVGCEGLNAIDGHNILIRDDPEGFAAAIRDILHDDDLRQHLEVNARHTAESEYSWNVIGDSLVARYRDLLRDAALHAQQ
jgi:polysaccharide biosynthesis protein PslH